MSYGKSQAATITAQAMVAHNPNTIIGVASESVYKRLIEIGIPEANIVKMWEKQKDKTLEFWYDELCENGFEYGEYKR